MKIHELIRSRRSIFPDQYVDRPVAKEDIEMMLEAANWAPTHRKTEPWRFKVVQKQGLVQLGEFLCNKYKETTPKDKFSEFKHKKMLQNPQKAGAVILICMQRDEKERLPEWEEIAATAMAVQNMWLTATELGLGAYWSSPGLIQYMHEFVDLAPGERCLGLFYVGHYEGEHPEGQRQDIAEKVEWIF
ncbi:nitroreductase family protein [Croceiramulus getboli]|nr:nitroreductase [Flavobacteriaceae bacterium YJPT1-3]